MIETTGEKEGIKDFNLYNLPPEGSRWVGKFFNELWEDARKEKIERLGMHQRWMDLHAQYRGKRRRRTYPRVGVNHIFKTVETYCATLTEKMPISEITADNADNPEIVQAFDSEMKLWWENTKQQFKLRASTQNMQIYGNTIEKAVWDHTNDRFEIIVRDVFNGFPHPGYKLCDMDIPSFSDVDFLEPWEIREKFGIPENITIPTDADEQVAGTEREMTRGGYPDGSQNRNNFPTNYSNSHAPAQTNNLQDKTMVVEIWCHDGRVVQEPIIETVQATDDLGRPLFNQDGSPVTQEIDTGEVRQYPAYPDGVRKVTICPALLNTEGIYGVLDDSSNPTINWTLLKQRIDALVQNGIPQAVIDDAGNPVVDPMTGQPAVRIASVDPETAMAMIYSRAKISYPLWGKYSFNVTPSRIDTSQWWGFSIIEQLEELQGKAELMLTKYLLALEWQMFPALINPQSSGVNDSEFDNGPGIKIRPTVATAQFFRYMEPPAPPREYLEALQFLLGAADETAMTPAVTQGQRPTGISAAAAIIALQDKASTLSSPQIQQIDQLIEWRGKAYIHFNMNWDYEKRQVMIDGQAVEFRGIDLFTKFNYKVESGSSAPITKAGRRQQYVELFKLNAMDLESLLTYLEIPQAKLIVERIREQQSVPGALEILAQAGVPKEVLAQLYMMVQGDQFGPKPSGGTTAKTPEQAGGYSEGINAAKQGMSELREG